MYLRYLSVRHGNQRRIDCVTRSMNGAYILARSPYHSISGEDLSQKKRTNLVRIETKGMYGSTVLSGELSKLYSTALHKVCHGP